MHQAASLQFDRVMDELVLWHAVPEDERSPAPAWWWGPAMAVSEGHELMPHAWCCELGLGDDSSFAEGAQALFTLFAEQTSLPWPDAFPRKAKIKENDIRELQPLPSDDSAFQP
jgi:hypothetical protein